MRRSATDGRRGGSGHNAPLLGIACPYGEASDAAEVRRKQGARLSRRSLLLSAAGLAAFAAAPREPAFGAAPSRLVALGDSLTAGLGLPLEASFPALLQRELASRGVAASITNAGVSGDTAEAGLRRLDWSVPQGTPGVILELGANDALRGMPPQGCEAALERIISTLQGRGTAVLLCGMYAPRNLGSDYVKAFDGIYPRLAARHGLLLYPFFLEGVAGKPALVQPDGLHPNAEGVRVIVAGILPTVEQFLGKLAG